MLQQFFSFCTNFAIFFSLIRLCYYGINVGYIINRTINGCLELPHDFPVLNIVSHSFAKFSHEISRSSLKIDMIFLYTYVQFSLYKIPM